MKALIFDKSKYSWEDSKGFELADVPRPVIQKDDDVIIRVQYAGVCGSDRGMWYRRAFRDQVLGSLEAEKKDVRIMGHEFAGEVVEVGKAVKDIKPGDFVSAECHVVCNQCYQCLRGEKNVCTKERILGISYDGIFAEYTRVPAHVVWKTDKNKIRPEIAAIQDPLGNAVHAASKVDLRGKTVAIFGLGPIGLFEFLVVRGLGAKMVIGIEPRPEGQRMAKALGIDHIISLPQSDTFKHDEAVVQEILKLTDGVGVDVSFEMAGFNSSVNNAIFSTRRGGDVILFGLKNGDFVLEDFNRLVVRGQTLHAVIGRQMWQTWETTTKLLEDKTNGIAEKIWDVILEKGLGTIVDIKDYNKEMFEQKMNEHTKLLIKF